MHKITCNSDLALRFQLPVPTLAILDGFIPPPKIGSPKQQEIHFCTLDSMYWWIRLGQSQFSFFFVVSAAQGSSWWTAALKIKEMISFITGKKDSLGTLEKKISKSVEFLITAWSSSRLQKKKHYSPLFLITWLSSIQMHYVLHIEVCNKCIIHSLSALQNKPPKY